jgi:S-adenosylmethionine:tRNA ribosyltransferase-isomerase
MHSESYTLTDDVADRINQHKLKSPGNKILTVGTTSTRVLESCAQLTSKGQLAGTNIEGFDPHYTSRFELKPGSGETNIFIYPPYKFKMVDALLTNFHMPGLTPVM